MNKSAQEGFAHVFLLVAAIGLVGFILLSSAGNFKNNLFAKLFPRQSSQASITFPTTPNTSSFVTNPGSQIHTLLATNSGVYGGGSVNYLGPYTGSVVPVLASTGIPVSNYTQLEGQAYTSVADGSGGWYVSGFRLKYRPNPAGAATLQNLIHILANGSVDNSFNPNPDGTVETMVLSPDRSTLYVGGTFRTIGGQSRFSLAAINTATKAVTDFDANVSGFGTANIRALAINSTGTTLYIGGYDFSSAGGVARNKLAALNTSTGAATSFLADINGSGLVTVNSLVLNSSNSILYVGGTFTTIRGVARNNLASLNPTTGAVNSFNPNVSGFTPGSTVIFSMALSSDGSTLYLGGLFSGVSGQLRDNLASVNASTGALNTFNPGPIGQVQKLLILPDQSILVGGSFNTIAGQSKLFIASLDSAGSLRNWGYNATSSVRAMALSSDNTNLLLGGSFNSYSNLVTTRNYSFKLNLDGSAASFNPNPDYEIYSYAISPDGNTLYFGGDFFQVGAEERHYFAAVDANTGVLKPIVFDFDSTVTSVKLSPNGNILYVSGWFTTINGQPRNGLAAIDLTTATLTNFNPDIDGAAMDMVLSPDGSILYIGGISITTINGQPRNGLAAINTSTGVVTNLNFNVQPVSSTMEVRALALSSDGSTIYIGGKFTGVGGQTRNNFAAASTVTGNVLAINPNPDDRVMDIVLSNDNSTLFLGGDFYNIAGQPRANLASIDASGSLSSWNPLPIDYGFGIETVALSPDNLNLYIGGGFTNGVLRYTLSGTPPPTPTAIPSSSGGISNPVTPSPSASCPLRNLGDINCSGRIDIFDYNLIVTDFGKTDTTSLRSDLNGNGRVDIFDYNIIVSNYGRTN